ncbi:hypothetical protein BGZ63DRAFT_428644 [Mariannaea sp. PMI_226]|nr:hypothetical protein BGZ63DRAFT_428644 [Mariannaea sp. PMI_226]
MFGTWKYDPETDEVQSLRNAFDPVTARSSSHQACDRCHEKKLRCSGDKTGCDRCRGNNLRCEYTRSGSKSSRKSKKSGSSRSADDDGGASSSSSRRGGSSSVKASSSSKRHHGGGRSSRDPVSGQEDPGILNQFDFSSLSPEDGFDFTAGEDPYGGASASNAGGYAVPVSSADYMQMQQGTADVAYQQSQSWDEYMAMYGQQPGNPHEDWSQYGNYPHQ